MLFRLIVLVSALSMPWLVSGEGLPSQSAPVRSAKTATSEIYQQIWSMQRELSRLEVELTRASLNNSDDDLRRLEKELKSTTAILTRVEAKLATLEAIQQQDMTALSQRIDDIHQATSYWGYAFTLFGGLFGGAIAIAAIGLGFSAKTRAVSEAKSAAQQRMQSWLDNEASKQLERIKTGLEQQTTKLLSEAKEHSKEIGQIKDKAGGMISELANQLSALDQKPSDEQLDKLESELKAKDDSEYSAEDWFSLSLSQYFEQSMEDSLRSLSKVLTDPLAKEELVSRAMFNRGCILGDLDRQKESIEAYKDVVVRFGEREEPALLEQVAMALFNMGVRLGQLDHQEEAIEAYKDVVVRFGERKELALLEQVAKALFNMGVCLGELDRHEEAIETYKGVVVRLGEREEPALLEQVAKALVNMGIDLGELNRHEEAIEAHRDVVVRFGEREEPALLEPVAKALLNMGVRLGELDRHEEAVKAYRDVVARFGEREEVVFEEVVDFAKKRLRDLEQNNK